MTEMMRRLAMVGVVVMGLGCAGVSTAQPGCHDEITPVIAAGQGPGTGDIVYATPPTAAQPWGQVDYPISYVYPAGAISVGLMTLTAQTFKMPGWQVQRAGGAADPRKTYVLGRSGRWYEWVPDGIRYSWYHVPDLADLNPVTLEANWYRTLEAGDTRGFDTNLSVVLQRTGAAQLAIVTMYPYPEPIRVNVQLHARVCR